MGAVVGGGGLGRERGPGAGWAVKGVESELWGCMVYVAFEMGRPGGQIPARKNEKLLLPEWGRNLAGCGREAFCSKLDNEET